MNNIRLEINTGSDTSPMWQVLYLPDDASIDIETNSPLWNDNETFSERFIIPIEPNLHVLGNSGSMFGKSIYKALYRRKFRLWVCGILYLTGTIDMDSEVDVDEEVEINLVSGIKTFKDKLDGVNAQDVEIYWGDLRKGYDKDGNQVAKGEDDNITKLQKQYPHCKFTANNNEDVSVVRNVPIGYTYNSKILFNFRPRAILVKYAINNPQDSKIYKFENQHVTLDSYIDVPQVVFQHVGFKEGGSSTETYTNTSHEYVPGAGRYKYPYCNITICGQKASYEGDAWEKKRGYTVFGPSRLNSSPCFFVLFWLEQLLDIHLNIRYDISKLTSIKDMLSLCFINYKCKFDDVYTDLSNVYNIDFEKTYDDSTYQPVNTNKPVGSRLLPVSIGSENGVELLTMGNFDGLYTKYTGGFDSVKMYFAINGTNKNFSAYNWKLTNNPRVTFPSDTSAPDIASSELRHAMATGENFPDKGAKEIIEALENAFGFKFMYDDTRNSLTVVRYSDVLTDTSFIDLKLPVTKPYKTEINTRGFRLRYSSSREEKKNALTDEEEIVSGGDDTTFSYNDYRKIGTIQDGNVQHDYCVFTRDLDCYDDTFYISRKTGNGYRIKVDEGAANEAEWYPSLSQVGGFRAWEYGDCSEDEFVETKEIGFNPFIENDINIENEQKMNSDSEVSDSFGGSGGKSISTYPFFAGFVNKDLHPSGNPSTPGEGQHQVSFSKYVDASDVWFSIREFMYLNRGSIGSWKIYDTNGNEIDPNDPNLFVGVKTDTGEGKLQFNFAFNLPQGCDDNDPNGNPLNSEDAGFTLGFLRPATSSSGIVEYDHGYDGTDNCKFFYQASTGGGQITSDSCDQYGHVYLNEETIDGKKVKKPALSLKLKAEKPVKNPLTNTGDERPFREASDAEYNATEPRNRKMWNGKRYIVDYDSGNPLYYPITVEACRNRGLADRFWTEYAYFVTHRKKAVMTIPKGAVSLTTLINIDLTKRYRLGGIIGFINKISYNISKDGIGEVEVEMYYL